MNTWRNLPGKLWIAVASIDPLLRKRARKAADVLSEDEAALLLEMKRYDLAHSLAVAGRLNEDLLLYRAALLHDAGKLKNYLGLSTRWVYTWMEIFAPRRLKLAGDRLEDEAVGESALERARGFPKGWRRGLYVQMHHGEIGAEILSGLGSDPELVRLVGGHQKEPTDGRSKKLKEVDDIL
jgi:hypothetical protein